MLQFSNNDTVAVHVTKSCNMRCSECYQDMYSEELDLDKAAIAIESLNPKNIVLFGGEPLVRTGTVEKLLGMYSNKGVILHTNGTIYNKDILDEVDVIYLTLESFIYERQPQFRKMSKKQFETLLRITDEYGHKIIAIHNIYPYDNDSLFYEFAELKGIRVNTYPIVSSIKEFDIDKRLLRFFKLRKSPLTQPKLRILEDGTITRDMRGIYNICKFDKWKDEYLTYKLPMRYKCKTCTFLYHCPYALMFPHFVLDTFNENYCKTAKNLWKISSKSSSK